MGKKKNVKWQVRYMKNVCLVDMDMSVTGGVEHVTASLANALCETYNVYVYEMKHSGRLAYEFDERVCFHAGAENVQRLREMFVKTIRPFICFVKEKDIDVVLMMGNYPALLVSFARFFTKAKYVFCDHGGLMNEWHLKDITMIRFLVSRLAHQIIVLTDKTKQDYIEKFHTNRKKISRIYNWIEDEILEAERPYNINSRKILSVGRLSQEKGYDMLMEIAKDVLPLYPEWQWHIYGNGEMFDKVSEQVIECGLEHQLILKGNVEKAYKVYCDYAFLVLPSYREGLPLVLLEAGALGIPMVSFDIETGPNEIIEQGENGFLVEPYSLKKMREQIIYLIDHPERRKKMSEYKNVRQKFNKETILQQWIKLIEG